MDRLQQATRYIRQERPLVHHITNLVTINDCANITLAIGALPIMAMDPLEVEEVTSGAQSLVINMGTLSELGLAAMLISGKVANELNIPIVLDPTGVGISKFRQQAIHKLLANIKVDIIKGNASEIKTLLGLSTTFKGVDALEMDTTEELSKITQQISKVLRTIAVCTGEIDIIADGKNVIHIKGGNPMLKNVTGAGCMLGSLMGSYLGTNINNMEAAEFALRSMHIAGERAYTRMVKEKRGSGSYKVFLIDEIYKQGQSFFITL